MGKSKTVRFTSEELKRRESKTDWDAVANITDEEIEAAIASDPEESELHERLIKRGQAIRSQKATFVIYMSLEPKQELVKNKVYKVVPDEKAAKRGMIKVTDEMGAVYLYDAKNFAPVQLPEEAERKFVIADS